MPEKKRRALASVAEGLQHRGGRIDRSRKLGVYNIRLSEDFPLPGSCTVVTSGRRERRTGDERRARSGAGARGAWSACEGAGWSIDARGRRFCLTRQGKAVLIQQSPY